MQVINKDNTILKIKVEPNKFTTPSSFISLPLEQIKEEHKTDKNSITYFTYRPRLLFRNSDYIAQIDVEALSKYPKHEHHLKVRTYDERQQAISSEQVQIVINFFSLKETKGLNYEIILSRAQIKHETQFILKMSPFVKIKTQKGVTIQSKVIKSGGKSPNFNNQRIALRMQNINQMIQIELWDKDFKSDDFIGMGIIYGCDIIMKEKILTSIPLLYREGNKNKEAGQLFFTLNIIRS